MTLETVTVAAGIIWKDGQFLAARRPEGKPRAGYWEFPGGKQEPGETIEETLARELKEELGITCVTIAPWQVVSHTYPDLHVTLHFMHVTEYAGEPVPHDGQELVWVTPEEACFLPFLPADEIIVAEIMMPSSTTAQK